jgi:hypothetical protein
MRIVVAIGLLVCTVACSGAGFRQYEYEEELYLGLDGTATLYVNSSVEALAALRGARFDPAAKSIDRAAVREYFSSPATRVSRTTTSRRRNRTYIHVRIDVDDIGQLPQAKPFSWSSYKLASAGQSVTFDQEVGFPASLAAPPASNWRGDEIVAFRVHVPSKVEFHNAGSDNLKRGNILVWEQSLADRLRGEPLKLEVRMGSQSILYSTLWLFAGMIVAVALTFVAIIAWVVRRATPANARVSTSVPQLERQG